MRSCSKCHQVYQDSARHCSEDGEALSASGTDAEVVLVGQYRLLERVGQGGSGSVYRAWQIGVGRTVAVKILSKEVALSPEFVTRFTREAQAAAHLDHPHIIKVFDVGVTGDGLPFMVMQWIEAQSWRQDSPNGTGAFVGRPEDVIEIAKQVTSALIAAHALGIVHRDLKPDNLLLHAGEGRPWVTMLDFGIAKFLDTDMLSPGETHLTKLGMVYGTPYYLSPEQAGGETVDPRSDLYSLGVVLYELVSGRLPFRSSGVALLADHLDTPPADLRDLALVPEVLADLIMDLLAKKAKDRPQSAIAVLGRLSAMGRKGGVLEAARKSSKVPRRVLALSLCTLVAAFAAFADHGFTAQSVERQEALVTQAPFVRLVGPQKALLVTNGGVSVRVLLPEVLHTGLPQGLAIEVWDPAGLPLAQQDLRVRFEKEGVWESVSIPIGSTAGQYELERRFDIAGPQALEVSVAGADVAMTLYFEVEEEQRPNS